MSIHTESDLVLAGLELYASAGNGGIITVRVMSTGDGVAYILNGGEDGAGDFGEKPGCHGADK